MRMGKSDQGRSSSHIYIPGSITPASTLILQIDMGYLEFILESLFGGCVDRQLFPISIAIQ